jgi:hypothetical protein
MTSTRSRVRRSCGIRWTARLALLAALSPVAVMSPTANADAVDDAFVSALKSKGIHFQTPQKAVIAAHEVCDELDNGKTTAQVASTVQSNSDLDGYHAGYFVGASIRAYCPKYAS